MNYISANDILPDKLLQEVQKYVQGKSIYIPAPEDCRKKWGQLSGQRDYLHQRNMLIKQSFRQGISVAQLAQTYWLSEETIKKIVYKRD